MNVLLTGGAGYIGSHTFIELMSAGYTPIIYDNFSNSSPEVLQRLKTITGKKVSCITGDILDKEKLAQTFQAYKIDAVIHFAGLKAVGESVEKPLSYYQTNVSGTLNVLEVMKAHNVHSFIFSSSATVYGTPHKLPITEEFPTGQTTNPYGRSKYIVEEICKDFSLTDKNSRIGLLRYFNPIGAHPSGLIGEDPKDIPNNLVPYVTQTAIGKRDFLSIFGHDYPTKDGTGIRDYIHVLDLAKGHVAMLNYLTKNQGLHIYNLGTGTGYSVLDIVQAFSDACGYDIPHKFVPRRPGDIAECWSDCSKAAKDLNWVAERTLAEMATDSWNWQKNNPDGY